jgi:hypothetical protein
MKPAEPSVKIAFTLDSGDWHGHSQERLWATPTESGAYILDNSPFYADGVSYLDKVSANWDGYQLVFSEIIERGGHSTYRIRLPPDKTHGYFLELWAPFEKLGCTYEGTGGPQGLYAVDIPRASLVHAVYDLLQALEDAEVIEFDEGHYCPTVAEDAPK